MLYLAALALMSLRNTAVCFAEYVILPDHIVVRKPRNISFAGVGGIGASEITAMQFAEVTNLNSGDRVFITDTSNGTGFLVIQAA